MFGKLSRAQKKVLKPFVEGRVVYDLGAGTMALSRELVKLGSTQVWAIDKNRYVSKSTPAKVFPIESYFEKYTGPMIDRAFISWPSNNEQTVQGLLKITAYAEVLIYLGKCTDGCICATPSFFEVMQKREVLAYAPHRKNTLIVYGPISSVVREPRGEEIAGLIQYDDKDPLSYAEAERIKLPARTV